MGFRGSPLVFQFPQWFPSGWIYNEVGRIHAWVMNKWTVAYLGDWGMLFLARKISHSHRKKSWTYYNKHIKIRAAKVVFYFTFHVFNEAVLEKDSQIVFC